MGKGRKQTCFECLLCSKQWLWRRNKSEEQSLEGKPKVKGQKRGLEFLKNVEG